MSDTLRGEGLTPPSLPKYRYVQYICRYKTFCYISNVVIIRPLQNYCQNRKKRYKRKEKIHSRYKTHASSSGGGGALQKICRILPSGKPVSPQGKKSVTKVSLIANPLPSGMTRYKTPEPVKLGIRESPLVTKLRVYFGSCRQFRSLLLC